MPKMICGEGDFITDTITDNPDIIRHHIHTLLGNLNSCEWMFNIIGVANTQRLGYGIWNPLQQRNPQIHLQKGKSVIHPFFQPLPGYFWIAGKIGVAINPYLVTVFAPQHLIDRYTVGFPR